MVPVLNKRRQTTIKNNFDSTLFKQQKQDMWMDFEVEDTNNSGQVNSVLVRLGISNVIGQLKGWRDFAELCPACQ